MKTEQYKTIKKPGDIRCSDRKSRSCSTLCHSGVVYVYTNRAISLIILHKGQQKRKDCDYNNRNMSVFICKTDIPQSKPTHGGFSTHMQLHFLFVTHILTALTYCYEKKNSMRNIVSLGNVIFHTLSLL